MKIILPNKDGVANLEIRRLQSELEGKPPKIEMLGEMPADLAVRCIRELEKAKKAIEEGNVSSLCVMAIMPVDKQMETGLAFISAANGELPKLDEMFHIALAQQPMGDDPDEAG